MSGRFYAYARRGMRTLGGDRDAVSFTLDVKKGGSTETVEIDLSLAGPGNVSALQPTAIGKNYPVAGSVDMRAGGLPYVEFTDPMLPWVLSPHGWNNDMGIDPWMALLCFPSDLCSVSIGDTRVTVSAAGLATASVSGGALLPEPNHVQMGAHIHDPDGKSLDTEPGERAIARLVSLQQLKPRTKYTACVVPLFEDGRLAGLGQEPTGQTLYAWQRGDDALTMPVYHHWTFTTGAGRGAEDMLRDLTAFDLDDDPAEFPMSAKFLSPIKELDQQMVVDRTLFIPIHDPFAQRNPDEMPVDIFNEALDGALSPHFSSEMPIPSYGRAYADEDDAHSSASTEWFQSVNRDFGLRRLAGAGTNIVRKRQEEMVAFIGEDAGAMKDANAIISRAHAARQLNAQTTRTLGSASITSLVGFAGPAAARTRIMDNDGRKTSLKKRVEGTVLDVALSSAVARQAGRRGLTPEDMQTGAQNAADAFADADHVAGAAMPDDLVDTLINQTGVGSSSIDVEQTVAALLGQLLERNPNDRPKVNPADEEMQAWAQDTYDRSFLPKDAPKFKDIDDRAGRIPDGIKRALDPANSVPPRIAQRIGGAGELDGDSLPLRLIHDPVWPDPLFEMLLEDSPELIAPNLREMPENSLTGVFYDPRAMEAVMVGANHELLRELRWRGMPVPNNASPIRRAFPAPTDGSPLNPDIEPIGDWGDTDLGEHGEAPQVGFVTVMRTPLLEKFPDIQVMLCKAVMENGQRTIDLTRTTPVLPIMYGKLSRDLSYVGFPDLGGVSLDGDPGYFLTFVQPKKGLTFGLNAPTGDAPQTPTDLSSWNALSWSDLSGDDIAPNAFDHSQGPAGLAWGKDGARMAGILLERPVVVAIHLSDIL
ncbi:hypothetical protein HCZ30_15400 [Marivivens donghaensis]|uniref:Uncharacterized protein n=1 Tax=Marivivens donghaensis TaxID=1699413 RepID=A0ABX0W1F4_9RHOB|nr:hypothetical protein [Marivivens donghaensis]NIY73815.1 hypothetical protein [Marivivens donghaensis]